MFFRPSITRGVGDIDGARLPTFFMAAMWPLRCAKGGIDEQKRVALGHVVKLGR